MKPIAFFFIFLFTALSCFAQSTIRYHVDLENVHHHELGITIEFSALPLKTLSLKMPDTSPGRYAEHSFAKNVYAEAAFDEDNKALKIYRMGIRHWEIPSHQGYVKFKYTLYGNDADGTYNGFDSRKAHLNMPASFIYGEKMENRPIEVTFDLSNHHDWKVATQLDQKNAMTFTAPDYYYFYDSPVIIGDIDFRSWKVESAGKSSKIEVAMLHEGTDKELDNYVEMVKKVVEEEKQIFGELPDFDFGRYTFLCSYNPWVNGDGMEHRNSTICTSKRNLKNDASALIGTISHEFFHCWNAERLRPASLEPFDFDEANLSGELWFVEGFTNYYDDLVLARAGIITPVEYIERITGTFNKVMNSPGRGIHCPVEMSYHAPFVDASSFNDETNFGNTFISYYSYGQVLGTALDLSLRSQFPNLTLDDYMKHLWEHFGEPEIPYEIPDLQQALSLLTGDPEFARSWFDNYIYEGNLPDFKALFANFGIAMELDNLGKVKFGNSLNFGNDTYVRNKTIRGHPFYEAGLEKGDKIIGIAGRAISDDSAFTAFKEDLVIGKSYKIRYEQLGLKKEGSFIARQDPGIKLTWLPDKEISKELRRRRQAWLKIR